MAKLFIANLSKQHHQFLYRVAENQNVRTQDIPIGSQVRIEGELSPEQIAIIVDHHRSYGLKTLDEARKIKGFTGLVYSVDKPVSLAESGFIEEVIGSNDETLNQRSEKRRQETTAAISGKLEKIGEDTRATLKRTEVEQSEETSGVPRVASGVEAVPEGVEPRNRRFGR